MAVQIEDYIQGEEHFVPIHSLPVVAPATRLSDTLALMDRHGAGAALVQRSADELDLFLPAATAQTAPGQPLADWPDSPMSAGSVTTYPLALVDASTPVEEVVYGGPPGYELVGVRRGGELVGLLTQHEGGKEAVTSRASYYRCTVCGRAYHPPPPPACSVDGGNLARG